MQEVLNWEWLDEEAVNDNGPSTEEATNTTKLAASWGRRSPQAKPSGRFGRLNQASSEITVWHERRNREERHERQKEIASDCNFCNGLIIFRVSAKIWPSGEYESEGTKDGEPKNSYHCYWRMLSFTVEYKSIDSTHLGSIISGIGFGIV